MSAEVLRRAAALMRERAEAATLHPKYGLPWMVDEDENEQRLIVLAPKDVGGWDGICVVRCTFEADADHIASWHPAVALAVADWLDHWANLADHAAASGWPGFSPNDPALAVARAYLGADQ